MTPNITAASVLAIRNETDPRLLHTSQGIHPSSSVAFPGYRSQARMAPAVLWVRVRYPTAVYQDHARTHFAVVCGCSEGALHSSVHTCVCWKSPRHALGVKEGWAADCCCCNAQSSVGALPAPVPSPPLPPRPIESLVPCLSAVGARMEAGGQARETQAYGLSGTSWSWNDIAPPVSAFRARRQRRRRK